jgi:hypothetical protein
MPNIAFKLIESYGLELNNLDKLTAVQKKQLVICAKLYGEVVIDETNVEDFFSDEIDADFYHVVDVDTNEIIFDFWNYGVDSGTLFVHNTSNYAGFEMIQFSIDHIETNQYNKHLPEGFDEILNDAFEKIGS